jgi:hypothetical protein
MRETPQPAILFLNQQMSAQTDNCLDRTAPQPFKE